MMNDGVIKFSYHLTELNRINEDDIAEINYWRQKLYEFKLIGINSEGIGFGNISFRNKENSFIITGSNTGRYEHLETKHYAKISSWNFAKNFVECEGMCPPSSESLTHAAIYEKNSRVNAVIHIHNKSLWKKLKEKLPTTPDYASYGTVEIAKEIQKLISENDCENNIIILGGHEDGIAVFGRNLDEAGKKLFQISDLSLQI